MTIHHPNHMIKERNIVHHLFYLLLLNMQEVCCISWVYIGFSLQQIKVRIFMSQAFKYHNSYYHNQYIMICFHTKQTQGVHKLQQSHYLDRILKMVVYKHDFSHFCIKYLSISYILNQLDFLSQNFFSFTNVSKFLCSYSCH